MTRKYDESSIKLLLSERAAHERVKRSGKRYYVYLIYGGTMGLIYVGKGTRGRFKCHEAEARKYLKANPDLPYLDWVTSGAVRTLPKVQRLAAHLSYAPLRYDFALFTDNEDKAFRVEKRLVKLNGIARKNSGILSNKVMGGRSMGPGEGRRASLATREKISKAHVGKKVSDETCIRISEALRGRKIPLETRKRMAEGQRRRGGLTEEHKKKVSASRLASERIKRVRVKIHGKIYNSVREAADLSGLTYNVINYSLRAQKPGFIRLSP